MRFKVGDKAVYPAHGVAHIEGIETRELGGTKMDFYVLRIASSGATLMVPTAASEKVGMRVLVNEEEIDQVFSILSHSGQKISQRTWNRRFREFNDKLRTGSVMDIAEVLRDLWSLQSIKELSYGEKKMLEKSKALIVSEIGASRQVAEEDVVKEIDSALPCQPSEGSEDLES